MEILQILAFSLAGLLLGYLLPKVGWDLAMTQKDQARYQPTEGQEATSRGHGITIRPDEEMHREVSG